MFLTFSGIGLGIEGVEKFAKIYSSLRYLHGFLCGTCENINLVYAIFHLLSVKYMSTFVIDCS